MAVNAKGQFMPVDPRAMLYSRFVINAATGCWDWTGARFQGGYGVFKCKAIGPLQMNAQRASWIIHNGPIASRCTFVCHTCDNRLCVNPDHLFLGSAKDNVDDMVRKGRNSRGESRPATTLTTDDVLTIRRMKKQGHKYEDIARAYGISYGGVGKIVRRESWGHVP